MIWHVEFLHLSLGLWLAYKETVGGTKCLQKLAGTPVLLLESFRFMFGVSTADCGWQFQVRSKESQYFWFWMSTSVFTWKNQQVCCHLELQKGRGSFISNTKCGWKFGFIASQTDWLKRKDFFSHIYLQDMQEKFWTERRKMLRELTYLKLPCPKFKHELQTVNVTIGARSGDSLWFVVTCIQVQKWI